MRDIVNFIITAHQWAIKGGGDGPSQLLLHHSDKGFAAAGRRHLL
jgi:hypothetical protein